MQSILLEKYGSLVFKPTGSLFDLDLTVIKKFKVCPLCLCKLYEMRGHPFFYCKSTKHKQKFIVHKSKM